VLTSEREHLSESELVRGALVAYVSQRNAGTVNMSALEQAGDLVGCFSRGPSDLSSNPRNLDDFGRVGAWQKSRPGLVSALMKIAGIRFQESVSTTDVRPE